MRHWKRAQPLPQKDVQVLFAPQVPWHSKIVLLLAGLQDSPLRPLSRVLQNLQVMDEVRRQVGAVFNEER